MALPDNTDKGIAEARANANLIAAAPDLLEALQAVWNSNKLPKDKHAAGTYIDHETFLVAAAIAKATGETI